uniref:H15 domain-containing protein n=1 Tax=Fagus sylvatica TaxID=28930 RepID=A0A2N9FPH1_FAGSY
MSDIGEVVDPAFDEFAVEVPVTEEPTKQAEKPVKEKKLKMIKDSLLALNEKNGSSPYAIAKYMEEKHKDMLPANYKKILGLRLKNSAAKGKLIKIKASYKLSELGKKDKVTVTKPAKPSTEKKPSQTKATTTTKKAVKKVGPKKTNKSIPARPKQRKSINSPAAKRAKKAIV